MSSNQSGKVHLTVPPCDRPEQIKIISTEDLTGLVSPLKPFMLSTAKG